MTNKYQRPAGAYSGASGLANRTKYQDDSNATPKRAVSSSKVDGDINYMIDALNTIDEASGSRASIAERLDVSFNPDGTLKASTQAAVDEWINFSVTGGITLLNESTISVGGDQRGLFTPNRRVRVTVGGTTLVGDVDSCVFSAGVTTIEFVDLTDSFGMLNVMNSVPTQIAYGPLTSGVRGNSPRRFDAVRIPVTAGTYEIKGEGVTLPLSIMP